MWYKSHLKNKKQKDMHKQELIINHFNLGISEEKDMH